MWILLPGGRVVNNDLIENVDVQGKVLVIHFRDFTELSIAYGTSGEAYYANILITFVGIVLTSGPPTLISVTPNNTVAATPVSLTVKGTNFILAPPFPAIAIGTNTFRTTFVDAQTLTVEYGVAPDGSPLLLAPGIYDLTHTDARPYPHPILPASLTLT